MASDSFQSSLEDTYKLRSQCRTPLHSRTDIGEHSRVHKIQHYKAGHRWDHEGQQCTCIRLSLHHIQHYFGSRTLGHTVSQNEIRHNLLRNRFPESQVGKNKSLSHGHKWHHFGICKYLDNQCRKYQTGMFLNKSFRSNQVCNHTYL